MADLSNLGMIDPSLSTTPVTKDLPNPGQPANPLDALLQQNSIRQEAQNQSNLSNQLDALKRMQGPGLLDKLTSLPGLLTLLGGAGAALAGQPEVGAGIALGGVGGAQAQQVAFEQAKDAQIKELNTELDKSMERQDKARQRFVTLLSSQPDMFSSPDGEAPNAKLLGWYATGTDIPLYPNTKRIMDERGDRWTNMFNTMSDGLKKARTPEDAATILTSMLNSMGMKNVDPGTVTALSKSFGTQDGNTELFRFLVEHGGNSARDAIIWGYQNGKDYLDPQVLQKIDFNKPSVDPSQQVNALYLETLAKVSAWQNNPANREAVAAAKQSAGNDLSAADRAIAEMALGGDTALVNVYLNKQNTQQLPVDRQVWMDAFNTIVAKDKAFETIQSVQGIPRKQNMTQEQILKEQIDRTNQLVSETNAAFQNTQLQRDSGLRNRAATTISKELPWGSTAIYGLVNDVWAAALADAPRDENGVVDRAKLEQLFNDYINLAIEQNKKKPQ